MSATGPGPPVIPLQSIGPAWRGDGANAQRLEHALEHIRSVAGT